MSYLNRIKCAASLSGTDGTIVVGAAKPGFRAPINLWTDGSTMTGTTNGIYTYLLESGSGEWEIGCVQVNAFGSPILAGGVGRNVLESSAGAFANGTSALTMTLVTAAESLWAVNRLSPSDAPPSAWGTGMAAGIGARNAADTAYGVAIGNGAETLGNYAIGIGQSASAYADGVAIGDLASTQCYGAIAIGKDAATTELAGGQGCIAVGRRASASGSQAIAVGEDAVAGGHRASGLGGQTYSEQDSVAIGYKAKAINLSSVALGAFVQTTQAGEIAIGSATRGRKRHIPCSWDVASGANSASGVEFSDAGGNDILLGALDAHLASSQRRNGVLRITGTICIEDYSNLGNTVYSKVIGVDYLVWITKSTSTAAVIGTPTITALFTGGSAPNSSITISTTTIPGVPKMTTTYTGGLRATGMLNIDDLQTNLE